MMNDQAKSDRDWSSLPAVALSLVLKCLNDTVTDRRRLRSVCTSWYSSLCPSNLPLHFPLGIVLPSSSSSSSRHKVKTGYLQQSVFYLISSPVSTGSSISNTTTTTNSVWLTRVKEWPSAFGLPNTWSLQNPISSVNEFQPMPEVKAEVNFLDYRISEVTRSYSLPKAVKVVMLPKSGATSECFYLLSLYCDRTLRLLKSGDQEWVDISCDGCTTFGDIIAFEGRFYAVDRKGTLISIDPVTFELKEIITSHLEVKDYSCDGLFAYFYLVESCGKLYMVNKVINLRARVTEGVFYDTEKKKYVTADSYCDVREPVEFKVSALGCTVSSDGVKKHCWEEVESLGDQVFFVSDYVSFFVSAREFGWSHGNCIFFTQEDFKGHEYFCYGDSDCDDVDHNYKSELQLFSTFSGLYTLEDDRVITNEYLPSKYTKIFWPVPTWLCSN